mgnify:CR=1 FL=1|tara:strand:+ start:264 stop:479 length:216 start_codon:yes stop_codon:yes gene_type:complete
MAISTTTIKVLSGGGFIEKVITSQTLGALRDELDMPAGSSLAVNAVDQDDSYEIQDGDIIASVSSNKTGGQ